MLQRRNPGTLHELKLTTSQTARRSSTVLSHLTSPSPLHRPVFDKVGHVILVFLNLALFFLFDVDIHV